MGSMIILEATKPLWSAISMSIDMNHADIFVFFSKSSNICKSNRVITTKHHRNPVNVKHFFYFFSHSSMGFNDITRRDYYIAIINGSKYSEWIDSCFYIKMFIWR